MLFITSIALGYMLTKFLQYYLHLNTQSKNFVVVLDPLIALVE